MRRSRSSHGIFPRRKTRIRHAVLEFKATADSILTPKFGFGPDCQITATVNNGVPMEIASNDDNVSISVTQGDTIRYIITKPESVTNLNFDGDKIAGNTSQFIPLTSLARLDIYNCSGIIGNTVDFAGLTSLTYLIIGNCTGIIGNTVDFAGLTSLARLHIYNCSGIIGNTVDFVGLTSLAYLNIAYCTGIIGDCSIVPVSNIDYWRSYNTPTTYGTNGSFVTVKNNVDIQMQDCNLPTADIDRVVDDLYASGATGGTCNIGGNNAAPSPDRVTKIQDMVNNSGWTFTYTGME